ncbi:alpha/beta fold hydrolase [Croceicoccus bisphenolivorans]|uniref:alpha/beta fold hydrolase n=1 Tax=Croceicoccus bisphenolivorans TaxID=1783232 RepID=UPI0008336AA2|nr:alpha/beta hydrolase [Croceicoccus bisphenolivorans]
MRKYEQHRFRSADNRLELFARDYLPVGEPGCDGGAEGLPLLLMHGLTRNSADFEPLVAHLPEFRLIVPDQRGRGLSDYDDDAANYRVDVYAADMFALMDGLGIERFGVIGNSMGGLIGMAMAAMAPGRVAMLALNDIGPIVDDAGLDRIRGYVGPSRPAADWTEMAERFAAVNACAFPDFTDADWLAFARRTCHKVGDGVVTAYDPAIAMGMEPDADAVVPVDPWPLWDALRSIPVFVIRGAISDLLSAATVAEMKRRHNGPFAAVEVALRGHHPLLDEPEVLAALPTFLQVHAV